MPGDDFFVARLFMIRMRFNRGIVAVVISAIVFWFVGALFQPHLYIEANHGIFQTFPVKVGEKLSISFIHSVQRTPVIENFIIEDSYSLTLDSTEYQSLGVGLPFLAEDGIFHAEQNKFVVSGMNRPHQRLSLRTGSEAKVSLTYNSQTIPLYSIFPAGTLVTVWVAPWYSRWL